jgi:hypothetical protein
MSRVNRRWLPVVTCAYLLALIVTTVVQHAVAGSTRHEVLTGSSTDVSHLIRDAPLVLLASAFWLPDLTSVLLAPFVLVVLAVGELRFGAARLVAAFATGHVLATLITEGSVWIGVRAHWLSATHEHRLDVGPSYGTCAVLGMLVAAMPRARRAYGFAALVLLLGIPLAVDRELTTTGHILAAAIGVLLWQLPWFRRGTARWNPSHHRAAGGVRRRTPSEV